MSPSAPGTAYLSEQSIDSLALSLQAAQQRLSHCYPASGWPFTATARQNRRDYNNLLNARTGTLEALYERLNPQLEHYLRKRHWTFRQSGTVEDLRNQIWLALLERIDGFDPNRGGFVTWFYTYVVLLVLNRGKRESARRIGHQSQQPFGDVEDLRCTAHGGFTLDCRQLLYRTVIALPLRWQAIILGLYYSEEPKKQKELAHDLGITAAAVTQNKAKALEHLRSALSEAGCDP